MWLANVGMSSYFMFVLSCLRSVQFGNILFTQKMERKIQTFNARNIRQDGRVEKNGSRRCVAPLICFLRSFRVFFLAAIFCCVIFLSNNFHFIVDKNVWHKRIQHVRVREIIRLSFRPYCVCSLKAPEYLVQSLYNETSSFNMVFYIHIRRR